MALFRYAHGTAPVRGHLVETLQRALGARGHDPNGIDGIFGPGVVRAVKSWRGRDDDGPLTVAEWSDITGLPAPSPFDLCIQITASFEGHGFTKVAGNWDGAYLTWGLIGFTLKHSLAPVLTDIEAADPRLIRDIFGPERHGALMEACAAGADARRALGEEISLPPNKYTAWARPPPPGACSWNTPAALTGASPCATPRA